MEDISPPRTLLPLLSMPNKTLLGPGPSNCPPRVKQATALPMVGHLHPECLKVMDDIKLGLQYAFQTRNELTLAVSATGHGGMETCLGNLLEKGDTILVIVNGIWGERAIDMATRYGATTFRLEVPPGEAATMEQIEEHLQKFKPNVMFVTHGESSTGVLHPIEGLGQLCHKYDCLLIVDAVASLGAAPLYADRWELDAVYSGSQKVLGVPPGLAPLTFSPRARARLASRKTAPPVFYFDLNLIGNYWGCDGNARRYHHTAPVSLLYALREGLALLAHEGLPACWTRHAECTKALHEHLTLIGVKCFVERPEIRLTSISSLVLPPGAKIAPLQEYAMQRYALELAGGLGPTAGVIMRVGLMGYNATLENVDLVVRALKEGLAIQIALPDSAKL